MSAREAQMIDEWKPQETLPNDDTIIEVRFVQVTRWNAAEFHRYHPDKSYVKVDWRPVSPAKEGSPKP